MNSPLPARRRRRTAAAIAILAFGAAASVVVPGGAAIAAWGRPPTGDPCGSTVLKPNGSAWTCTFADDFSGTSLDTNKWTVGQTATSGFSVGDTCLTANNIAEKNGTLRLTTQDLGHDVTCSSPYGSFQTQYTGAHIGTVGHFAQAYGRFDVRARYPQAGSGVHSAFWLYPVKQTYGAWPGSGEIDVAEWWSSVPNTVLPTLHYSGDDMWADSGWGCQVADPTVWHDYAVVWQPTQMQFSIDGTTCFTDTWSPDAPLVGSQPFDQPFAMVLTMAVDGSTNNLVTSQTRFPATYEIDYARAWK